MEADDCGRERKVPNRVEEIDGALQRGHERMGRENGADGSLGRGEESWFDRSKVVEAGIGIRVSCPTTKDR